MRSSSCQITRDTVERRERAAKGERGGATDPWLGSQPITLGLLILQPELQGIGASFSDPMV